MFPSEGREEKRRKAAVPLAVCPVSHKGQVKHEGEKKEPDPAEQILPLPRKKKKKKKKKKITGEGLPGSRLPGAEMTKDQKKKARKKKGRGPYLLRPAA